MRILFCNKYAIPFSGTEVCLFEIMELLRSHGHEVALFSMAESSQDCRSELLRVPFIDFKAGGALTRIRLAAHAIYSTDVRRRLRSAIADFRPDVAHVRNIYHHLSPSILWELHSQGIPVLYHLNDFKLICPSYNLVANGQACNRCQRGSFWHVVTERCYPGTLSESAVLAAENYIHSWLRTYETCVTRILAPSHFARQMLIENGWRADRIQVLHHFQRAPEAVGAFPDELIPVLYFGRLSREKGLISLLQAMRHLPHIPLLIAGEGRQEQELRTMAGELALHNVQFLGHVKGAKLARLIASSQFTVFPSLAYETLGKTILESYAYGRPVIATDLGSRRELVIPGETGLLYPPGNPEKLAEAIRSLYSEPGLARRMGEAAAKFVHERHSPEMFYVSLLGKYRELVEGDPEHSRSTRKTPRLRVAFIGGRGVGNSYSGIESYYQEVGQRLGAMGHEVTVYCRRYFTPEGRTHGSMRLVRLPCLRTKHLETLSHTLFSTLHAVFGPYDIVHFHALGPALFAFLPRLAGKKTTVTVQGLDWQRKKWGKFAKSILQLGEWAAATFPHSTTVVSRTLRDYYESKYGIKPTFIPNGTIIRERADTGHLSNWDLEPQRYLLFMGRFSPEKNCDLLIRAFSRVSSDTKLVLAGGAGYCDRYVAELRRHVTDRVRLLDWVSGIERDELLTNALLFVMPSDLEGLSLALLEAMGAGVCVLASDIAENRELVDGAGFTFRRGDERDLSRMLELLISDNDLRTQSARKGQERIRASYLWPDLTRQIEAEYLRLMRRDKRSDFEPSHPRKAA